MLKPTFYNPVDFNAKSANSVNSEKIQTFGYSSEVKNNVQASYRPEKSFADVLKKSSNSSKPEKTENFQKNENLSDSPVVREPEKAEKSVKTAESASTNSSENEKHAANDSQKVENRFKTEEKSDEVVKKDGKAEEKSNTRLKKSEEVNLQKIGKKENVKKPETKEVKGRKTVSDDQKIRMSFDSDQIQKMLLDSQEKAEIAAVQTEKNSGENNFVQSVKEKTSDFSEENDFFVQNILNSQQIQDEFSIDEEPESFGIKEKRFFLDDDKKISVRDLRKEAEVGEEKLIDAPKKTDFVTSVTYDNNQAQMQMELSESAQQNILSNNTQSAGAQNSNFQAMLSNQLQSSAGEIVKAGQIVLKDNDVGSIKLILKPESLGNVKIDLQISDKVITGKIMVQTQEAMNAFKENVESLKNAFNQQGFETSGFELSFAGQNSSQPDSRNQNEMENFQKMSNSYSAFTYSGDEDYVEEEISSFSAKSVVNIVA